MTPRPWLAPGWQRLLLIVLPNGLAAVDLVATLVFSPSPSAPAATAPPAPTQQGGQDPEADALPGTGGLLVEVTGAVARPGLYRLPKGERVSAAIAAAGGYTADADPDRLPALAGRLKDGQQIKVPARSSRGGSGSTRSTAVSLNSASADELAALPGFSSELATAAVRYRTDYGGFASTRELVTVLGMSEADYLLARRYVTI